MAGRVPTRWRIGRDCFSYYLSSIVLSFCFMADLGWSDDSCPAPAPLKVTRGLVSLIDDIQVPANRSGLITGLMAKEGAHLEKDTVLATIDMKQAELEARVTQAEHETARTRASADIEARYAGATLGVALAELASAKEANLRIENAVSKVEFERLKLSVDHARLKVEAAEHEQKARRTEVGSSQARLDLARHNVDQRRIQSPIAGEVAEVYAAAGEWIEAGQPLVRIVGLSRLKVETFVSIKDRSPNDLFRRAAKIQTHLVRESAESFVGKVTFVNPLIQPGGYYRVGIEVENRRVGEHWLLRPGLEVQVQISE